MKVKIEVRRAFNLLGVLEGDLDPTQLPMHHEGEEQPEKCVQALQQMLIQTENQANNGPLRLHVSLPE